MNVIADSTAIAKFASFGPYVLNPSRRRLTHGGVAVQLGTRAIDLLLVLVVNGGQVLTHKQLLSHAWPGLTVEDANLRVHISALRKALSDGTAAGNYIENLVGRGYSFVAPVTWSDVAAEPATTAPALAAPTFVVAPIAPLSLRLPITSCRLVGLTDLVEDLAAKSNEHRFVSIVGAGGMGKTTVSILVGQAIHEKHGREVVFVDLSPVRDPNLVALRLVECHAPSW